MHSGNNSFGKCFKSNSSTLSLLYKECWEAALLSSSSSKREISDTKNLYFLTLLFKNAISIWLTFTSFPRVPENCSFRLSLHLPFGFITSPLGLHSFSPLSLVGHNCDFKSPESASITISYSSGLEYII